MGIRGPHPPGRCCLDYVGWLQGQAEKPLDSLSWERGGGRDPPKVPGQSALLYVFLGNCFGQVGKKISSGVLRGWKGPWRLFIYLFKRFYLCIFSQRGREGEREGEKHQRVVASCMSPTGNLACHPGMCPDWELNGNPLVHRLVLNPLSPTSQGRDYLIQHFIQCYY